MMHFFFREKCVTFLSRDIIMKVVATVATPTQTGPLPARRRRSSRKQRLDRRRGSFVSRRRTTPTRIRMAAQHPLKGDDGALDNNNDALLIDRMKIAVQSATARPTQKHVVDALKDLASQEFGLANVKFTEVMQKIDELYDHNPQFGYSSGVGTEGGFETRNEAGANVGSNKVFYFAKMHGFTEEMTLRLFCEHYQNVLETPDGTSHLNIRSFMKNGWEGVRFDGETLRPKSENDAEERIDQI